MKIIILFLNLLITNSLIAQWINFDLDDFIKVSFPSQPLHSFQDRVSVFSCETESGRIAITSLSNSDYEDLKINISDMPGLEEYYRGTLSVMQENETYKILNVEKIFINGLLAQKVDYNYQIEENNDMLCATIFLYYAGTSYTLSYANLAAENETLMAEKNKFLSSITIKDADINLQIDGVSKEYRIGYLTGYIGAAVVSALAISLFVYFVNKADRKKYIKKMQNPV